MTPLKALLAAMCVLVGAAGWSHAAQQFVQSRPLTELIRISPAKIKDRSEVQTPIITWGGDIATIFANGNADKTAADSIFGKAGLNLRLVRIDDFTKQVELFMAGDMPYLRGTMGMINMAAELLSKDPKTRPIVIYQMTWSAGGDCLVVKQGISTARDLKGKTVALQAYGPHVDYLGNVLKSAGLTMNDVNIRWTKDLTGTDNTPGQAFQQKDVDAAFVIIPDGLMLTSNGTVGTGAEGSVKGAQILLSTKTANRIIADVYAVRADYLEANRAKVEAFVHGLLLADQQLKSLFKDKEKKVAAFKTMIAASAKLLMDSPQATADAEALYRDSEFVGFRGNTQFFGDPNWPRNFTNMTNEIQSAFVSIGLLSRKVPLEHAKWQYDTLRTGLTGIDQVESPRFKTDEVARVVERKRATGSLEEGELFSFEIFFQPNQNDFPADLYANDFKKVVEIASSYGGAVIIVEGHSDPMGFLTKKKENAPELILRRIEQAAKNLSLTRGNRVRDSIVAYAKDNGVNLDPSQFTVIGQGIMQPKTGICSGLPCAPKTKEEWRSNMRVVFRIIQLEAEQSVFTPLN
jgi:ABC-type nitrate/sulfonate/bicarbonate transport system substrate-binding protein/outer membrane protein OmpA-like peptidoglycan-associated protein